MVRGMGGGEPKLISDKWWVFFFSSPPHHFFPPLVSKAERKTKTTKIGNFGLDDGNWQFVGFVGRS